MLKNILSFSSLSRKSDPLPAAFPSFPAGDGRLEGFENIPMPGKGWPANPCRGIAARRTGFAPKRQSKVQNALRTAGRICRLLAAFCLIPGDWAVWPAQGEAGGVQDGPARSVFGETSQAFQPFVHDTQTGAFLMRTAPPPRDGAGLADPQGALILVNPEITIWPSRWKRPLLRPFPRHSQDPWSTGFAHPDAKPGLARQPQPSGSVRSGTSPGWRRAGAPYAPGPTAPAELRPGLRPGRPAGLLP
jgi:hypothetical protein